MLRVPIPDRTLAAATLCALTFCAPAGAQRLESTGSHLGSTISPRIVTRMSPPNEVREALKLIEDGKTSEALELVETYLDNIDNTVYSGESFLFEERYMALNAHCVVLTRLDRLEDAMTSCTEAIELNRQRWSAFNNRGAIHYLLGEYDQAVTDYQRARALAPDDDTAAMVSRNIRLAEVQDEATDSVDLEVLF